MDWTFVTIFGLPVLGVFMGLAVRLPPVLRFARSSPRKRAAVLAIAGLLSWLIAFEGWVSFLMRFVYLLGNRITDTYDPYPVNINDPAVLNELWLRQLSLWGKLGHVCFSANVAVCKVVDDLLVSLMYRDMPDTILRLVSILALGGALITMGVGWWQTRAKSPWQ